MPQLQSDQSDYFNPRSHEGSDGGKDSYNTCHHISIHAPTRGATGLDIAHIAFVLFQSTLPRGERPWKEQEIMMLTLISIHAPTRGATILSAYSKILFSDFNPRSHEGSDTFDADRDKINIISIHAPTRGATIALRSLSLLYAFQSTLPRGERLLAASFLRRYRYFNPRSHEGSDERSERRPQRIHEFQSTLPRGERQ